MKASSESGLWATVILREAIPTLYRRRSDDDSLSDRVEHDLRRVMEVELHHHVRAVCLHSRQSEIEQARDLLVRSSFGKQLQHFPLTIREQVIGIRQPARLQAAHVVLDENRRHGAAEERLAGRDRSYGRQQVLVRLILKQVRPRARCEGAEDVRLVGVHAEDDDLGWMRELLDA